MTTHTSANKAVDTYVKPAAGFTPVTANVRRTVERFMQLGSNRDMQPTARGRRSAKRAKEANESGSCKRCYCR